MLPDLFALVGGAPYGERQLMAMAAQQGLTDVVTAAIGAHRWAHALCRLYQSICRPSSVPQHPDLCSNGMPRACCTANQQQKPQRVIHWRRSDVAQLFG